MPRAGRADAVRATAALLLALGAAACAAPEVTRVPDSSPAAPAGPRALPGVTAPSPSPAHTAVRVARAMVAPRPVAGDLAGDHGWTLVGFKASWNPSTHLPGGLARVRNDGVATRTTLVTISYLLPDGTSVAAVVGGVADVAPGATAVVRLVGVPQFRRPTGALGFAATP